MITTYPEAAKADVTPANVFPAPTPTELALTALRADNSPSGRFLFALNALQKHIYAGTVPAAVVERRRKANKAARRARRAGR